MPLPNPVFFNGIVKAHPYKCSKTDRECTYPDYTYDVIITCSQYF
jgi:hypothetical protein